MPQLVLKSGPLIRRASRGYSGTGSGTQEPALRYGQLRKPNQSPEISEAERMRGLQKQGLGIIVMQSEYF
ncbi:MAG: hypothetical protein NZM15_02510 [Flavobacteriales bacterium]|nr:hypothetical protein [Flavobacteriales bacterium]MDW8431559.1 hypothetical protein [Flavobacteriales bacterium]